MRIASTKWAPGRAIALKDEIVLEYSAGTNIWLKDDQWMVDTTGVETREITQGTLPKLS